MSLSLKIKGIVGLPARMTNEDFLKQSVIYHDKNDIYVMRLLLHNQSYTEICEFLDVDFFDLVGLKSRLLTRFKCYSWYKTVIKAMRLQFLNPLDFVNPIVQEVALKYIKVTKLDLVEYDSVSNIAKFIKKFLNEVDKELNRTRINPYTLTEQKYIKLKFKGCEDIEIQENLKMNEIEYFKIQKAVQSSLSKGNILDKIKELFDLKILLKKDYCDLDIDKEILEFASNVSLDARYLNYTNKEIEALVYDALLKIFVRIELNYLSKIKY